jgi:hypothetical protein
VTLVAPRKVIHLLLCDGMLVAVGAVWETFKTRRRESGWRSDAGMLKRQSRHGPFPAPVTHFVPMQQMRSPDAYSSMRPGMTSHDARSATLKTHTTTPTP